jgi:hypothetical protein
MSLRPVQEVFLWGTLLAGVLAMPAAVVIGAEDGPMPADQLSRKKSLARTVLLTGGGVAASAAFGLYVTSRLDRRRA